MRTLDIFEYRGHLLGHFFSTLVAILGHRVFFQSLVSSYNREKSNKCLAGKQTDVHTDSHVTTKILRSMDYHIF